jgi:hypothetical protein
MERNEMPKLLTYDKEYLSIAEVLSHYPQKSLRDETEKVYTAFLNFCFDRKLIQNNPLENTGKLKKNYSVCESDLTETGKLYFDDLLWDWLEYTDRSKKIDKIENTKILEKYYNRMLNNLRNNNNK